MNYPIIRDFKFDPHQAYAVNRIPNEQRKLRANQWVFVPRHAPFFVDSLEMVKVNGEPMQVGVDYRIFRLMGKLTALTAKPVACLIEIINKDITEFRYAYHSVGKSNLFDRSLIDLINGAANDERLIRFLDIKNRPVVFDPEDHTHSLPFDTASFGDMIELFDLWASNLDKLSADYYAETVKLQAAVVRNYFERNGNDIKRKLELHALQYNAHGLKASHVGLENVDNYPDATVGEALIGKRERFLTPPGLAEIIRRYGYNADAFLKANVLPISFFGNSSFIPPGIGGSYEGMGSKSESAGICLELDGTITILSNHYDGKVQGLYFSTIIDYPRNPKYVYQSYRYQHPVLTSAGFAPSNIAIGSGGEVILIGNDDTPDWFVGLSNGTLNPEKHLLHRLNMSAFNQQRLNTSRLSVHLMGDYVIVIQTVASQLMPYIGDESKIFFRIPVSQFTGSGSTLTPTRMSLTYTNHDGTTYTNTQTYIWARPTMDNGRYTKMLFNFSPSVSLITTEGIFYRSANNVSCSVPGKPGIFALKMMMGSYFPMGFSNGVNELSYLSQIEYELNPATGVMTLINPPQNTTLNVTSPITDVWNQIFSQLGRPISNIAVYGFDRSSSIILDDGSLLTSYSTLLARTPHILGIYKSGASSKYDVISKYLSDKNFPTQTWVSPTEVNYSPLQSSIFVDSVTNDPEGEFFNGVGKRSDGGKIMLYRKVTGGFAIRPGFTNLIHGGVYSRALSNDVYATNMVSGTGRVGITGDANWLASAGYSNLGETLFSTGVLQRFFKVTTPGWSYGNYGPNSVQMPKNVTKTFTANNTVELKPTGFITWPDAIMVDLKDRLIPAAYRNTPDWGVVLIDTTFWQNNAVPNKPVVIELIYLDVANRTRRHLVASLRPSYDNSDPNNSVVTSVAILGTNDVASIQAQIINANGEWDLSFITQNEAANSAHIYYSGGAAHVLINTSMHTNHTGNASCCGTRVELNATTLAIVDRPVYFQTWEGVNSLTCVPGYGFAKQVQWTDTGAVAQLAQVTVPIGSATNGTMIGCISSYPDPAWQVFFQSVITAIFNGGEYELPAGMIDLRSVKTNPANSTFYVYATLSNGVPNYAITEQKRADTPFNIWVGTITTGVNQIVSIERYNVLLMNGQRISETKRGGAIPAVNGAITTEGQMQWIRTSEIIQN